MRGETATENNFLQRLLFQEGAMNADLVVEMFRSLPTQQHSPQQSTWAKFSTTNFDQVARGQGGNGRDTLHYSLGLQRGLVVRYQITGMPWMAAAVAALRQERVRVLDEDFSDIEEEE